jgi:hypothetical protein
MLSSEIIYRCISCKKGISGGGFEMVTVFVDLTLTYKTMEKEK